MTRKTVSKSHFLKIQADNQTNCVFFLLINKIMITFAPIKEPSERILQVKRTKRSKTSL